MRDLCCFPALPVPNSCSSPSGWGLLRFADPGLLRLEHPTARGCLQPRLRCAELPASIMPPCVVSGAFGSMRFEPSRLTQVFGRHGSTLAWRLPRVDSHVFSGCFSPLRSGCEGWRGKACWSKRLPAIGSGRGGEPIGGADRGGGGVLCAEFGAGGVNEIAEERRGGGEYLAGARREVKREYGLSGDGSGGFHVGGD